MNTESKFSSAMDYYPEPMIKCSAYAALIAFFILISCAFGMVFLEEWLGFSLSEVAVEIAINVVALSVSAYFNIDYFYKKNGRLLLKSEYNRLIVYTTVLLSIPLLIFDILIAPEKFMFVDFTPLALVFIFFTQGIYVWMAYSAMQSSYKAKLEEN